ncbi:hypothetical protein N3K67_20280 [Streptomyces sp. AV19]|nr:hypothetical protein [Streptomyces sp. AV19]MDG4534429.1 hypothetical protein [Streptomyces sp. AV19]
MTLRFIAKDPATDGRDCPTAWVEAEAEEILFQGWKPTEETLAKCREAGPIPETEAVVRIPFRMIPAIREACDVAERSRLWRVDQLGRALSGAPGDA